MSETPDDRRRSERRLLGRLLASFWSADSYGMVLLLIIASYGLSVALTSAWSTSLVLAIQIATVWFVLRTSHARRVFRLVAGALLVWSGGVALVHVFVPEGSDSNVLVAVTAGLLYLIAPLSILRHLALRRIVDLETFLGAVSAYLLIGMFFAYVYLGLGYAQASSFFGGQGDGSFADDLFFSFTTLTTTGYGSLVPAGNPGQSLAVLEMLLGQFFLITAVTKVVSAWTPRQQGSAGPTNA